MSGMQGNVEERIFVLEFLLDVLWADRISAIEDQEVFLDHLKDQLKGIVALESRVDPVFAKKIDSIFAEHVVSIGERLQRLRGGGS